MTTGEHPEFRRLAPADARAAAQQLRAVYRDVFRHPPYLEGPEMADAFLRWLADESQQPGFDLITAHADGTVVGFAYGHTQPAGTWWRGTDQPAPEQVRHTGYFAVMEWAVLPDYRQRGIGRELMHQLLADRDEPYASLMVRPDALARELYLRWGWQHVATTKPSRTMPGMHIMLRHQPENAP